MFYDLLEGLLNTSCAFATFNERDVPREVLCGDKETAIGMIVRLLDDDVGGRKSSAREGIEEWKCTKGSDGVNGKQMEGK